jgi:hypothetical protein
MNRKALVAVAAALALTLAGCSAAVQDRTGGSGKNPDQIGQARNVRVYANADDVPNVALFCLDTWAFASTLSGGDSGKDKASALLRLPDMDAEYCGGAAR